MRAIDFHVHLPTPDWLDGSMGGYVEAAEAYFRSTVQRQSLGELADKYRALDVRAVLLAWDAETATGRPRVPNETVAAACEAYPDAFTGIGSVDPHKGEAAVAEVARIAALGLRGVKFHPSLQAFAPDDPAYWPVFAACQEHGLIVRALAGDTVAFCPPLIVNESEIDEIWKRFGAALDHAAVLDPASAELKRDQGA